jgi:two-component system, cell cycle response regulator DivK
MNSEHKAKVLVVEDNEANLELFLDILEIGGYECIHTSEGAEAIEIAAKELPDLILLDIQLPGIDGLSVIKALRSMPVTKDIKTIALTAYAMKGDREMFLEKGFDGYIPKPVAVKSFLQTVKEYLHSHGAPADHTEGRDH